MPVVVVGAGPTGVVAASLLAQHGVRSVVLERFSGVYALPRAVHADDEVRRILQQLGVERQFSAVSRPAAGMRLVDGRRRVLAEFGRDGMGLHGHPRSNLFDQPDLERLLRDNLARLGGELRGGAELVGLDQSTAGGVLVTYREHPSGATRQMRAQAVLGCDGANSTVRHSIGATWTDLHFEERWFVVDVVCPVQLDVWAGVEQVCDPRRAATAMQVGPHRYRWEFRMLDGEDADRLADPVVLHALLAPWTGTVPWQQVDVVRSAQYTFRARIADRWQDRTVFLLGDAAHLTPPFVGQGMGAGLRDAHNLAWKLALVLGHDADPALLDTYEAERAPAARALIRSAVLVGLAMTGGHAAAAALRRAGSAAVGRMPGATRALSSTLTPPLRSGPLVQRARRWLRDPAGRPIPQHWVLDDLGRRVRLDTLLGNGFALISDGPVRPGLATLARQLGAAVLDVGAEPGVDGTAVDCDDLRRWLRRRGARAVLVRPDRVVLVAAPRRQGLGANRHLCRTADVLRTLLVPS